jgi:hypothetical protein
MMDKVRFLKHKVVNDTRGTSARVFYSLDNRTDGRKCVTLYAKAYSDNLFGVFPQEASNDSDSMSDYFCKDRVVLFESHPSYQTARKFVLAQKGIVEVSTPTPQVKQEDVEVATTYMDLLQRMGVKQISVL